MYGIIVSTIYWAGPKGLPLLKPDFIHGDRIEAPINYISDYVLFNYVNENGKEVIMSSKGPYQITVLIRLKKPIIPCRREMNLS